jgi:hypothetical protein
MKPGKPLIALLAFVAGAVAFLAVWPLSASPMIVFVTAEGETVTPRFDPAAFRDTRWYELGPKGWDPFAQTAALRRDIGSLRDSDPRAKELLRGVQEIWTRAPTNPDLDGKAIRIPGYVVPLDRGPLGMSEFLLVPYFGACIHSPPPPSNQILRVSLPAHAKGLKSMDQVWVRGTLRIARSETAHGASAYELSAVTVEPYVR